MESLAYTIVKLLRGRLPWKDEEPGDVLRSKLSWSGAALCAGYPPVFADLVDYTRALSFEDTPDYERWRRGLRRLMPESLPEDAVYNPEDNGEPRVGMPKVSDVTLRDIADGEIDKLVSGEDEDSLPDSDDGWIPTSSWPPPHIIKDIHLIGDEEAIVRAQLERIEEPPAMERYWLEARLVEVMET